MNKACNYYDQKFTNQCPRTKGFESGNQKRSGVWTSQTIGSAESVSCIYNLKSNLQTVYQLGRKIHLNIHTVWIIPLVALESNLPHRKCFWWPETISKIWKISYLVSFWRFEFDHLIGQYEITVLNRSMICRVKSGFEISSAGILDSNNLWSGVVNPRYSPAQYMSFFVSWKI